MFIKAQDLGEFMDPLSPSFLTDVHHEDANINTLELYTYPPPP